MKNKTNNLFQNTIQKTDEALRDIAAGLKVENESRYALSVLKTVLHAMRDRLTVAEAADLSAQLPVLIRGIFFEGWKPAEVPMKMNRTEFLERIRNGTPIEIYAQSEEVVTVVLNVLNRFISSGEMDDIKSEMPKSLAELFP